MVFDAQGDSTKAVGATLHAIAGAVAAAEGRSHEKVREEMFQRVALAIVRSNARAISRRQVRRDHTVSSILQRVSVEAALLQEPNEVAGDG